MRGLARRDRLTDPSMGLGGVLFALVVGVPASGSGPCTAPNAGVVWSQRAAPAMNVATM
jgi:hypothetical protein